MGCISNRRKQTEEFVDQKWDYFNLVDFKSNGCGAPFAYGFLWFSLGLSIAVYGLDSFTAVQLLVFNRWSSSIEPAIPFSVSKWIFSICILLSFVNLAYEGVRAARTMKRGNVADCYLDGLAVRWESIRLGSGQGYRRFLVFKELTQSKRGAEYVALFTYFKFQSWIRVILCVGPRQVVNALTLKSVYIAKLAVSSDSVEGSIEDFFDKIKTLAQEDYQQALILSSMCFTLVVWLFTALSLIIAALFYVFFLFHWIPRADGGLSGYCERKVNKTLTKIVTTKVNKALAKGRAEKGDVHRDATRPTLPNVDLVQLQDVVATDPLPTHTSPATLANFDMGAADWKRPMNSRTGTLTSKSSFSSSRAPLVSSAADMGFGRSASPAFSGRDIDLDVLPPPRTDTANSQRGFGPRPGMGHMQDQPTSSFGRPMTQSPAPVDSEVMAAYGAPAAAPMSRSIDRSIDHYNRPMPSDGYNWQTPAPRQHQAYELDGRSSPAPSLGPQRPPRKPMRSATSQVPFRGPQFPPQRTMTAPMPSRTPVGGYYGRSETPQGMQPSRQNFHGRPRTPEDSYGYGHEAQYDGRY